MSKEKYLYFDNILFVILLTLIHFAYSKEKCGVPFHKAYLNKRIIGGEPASLHSWPWQVRLQKFFPDKRSFKDICGGTIISNKFIITAAHCVCNKKNKTEDPEKYLVIAGDHDRSSNWDGDTQKVSLKAIHAHPLYDPETFFNDIAILELVTKLKYNANVSKCCISAIPPGANEFCYATGWGFANLSSESSDYLRQVGLPIVSKNECKKVYKEKLGDGMFCCGYKQGGKDTCQGDSGGPLVCKKMGVWFLMGLTSWGSGCGEPEMYGVYTTVSSYLVWIELIVKRYSIVKF